MQTETLTSMLHTLQDAYYKRDAENVDALCGLLFSELAEPIIIGAGSDEWFFGIEESKKLFLADWGSWGDFTLDLSTLRHGRVGARDWFALRAGVVYEFADSAETDRIFLHLVKETAGKTGPALARAGEILWLLSHLLHRRENRTRRYLWHVTLSGLIEETEDGFKIRSLQFALPADRLYPDERVEETGWERECYRNVGASLARWPAGKKPVSGAWLEVLSRWHEQDGGVEWLSDGEKRFIGFDGVMRDAEEFASDMQAMHSNWSFAPDPHGIVIDERDGIVFLHGLGLLHRSVSVENELENVLESIRGDTYADVEQEALFRIRRDLSRVLREAGQGSEAETSYRIEGMARIEGTAVQMLYFHLSTPFCHILEQKTDASEAIP